MSYTSNTKRADLFVSLNSPPETNEVFLIELNGAFMGCGRQNVWENSNEQVKHVESE